MRDSTVEKLLDNEEAYLEKQIKKEEIKKKLKNAKIDDEDFNLDDSDDLDKFIKKYESLPRNEDKEDQL